MSTRRVALGRSRIARKLAAVGALVACYIGGAAHVISSTLPMGFLDAAQYVVAMTVLVALYVVVSVGR